MGKLILSLDGQELAQYELDLIDRTPNPLRLAALLNPLEDR